MAARTCFIAFLASGGNAAMYDATCAFGVCCFAITCQL
jgi:hypothetical protein